jgi:hypothetical protein
MPRNADRVAGAGESAGAPKAASQETAGQRSPGQRRALGGILVRKECWTLSRPAKLLALSVCMGLGLAGIRFNQPFLAVKNRMHGEVLVVEGWIPGYALEQAVALTKTGDD